jgi:uncharacterized membrane protein
MNTKQYFMVRIVVVVILAIVVSQSVIAHNYIIPIIGIILASALLWYTRGKVTQIVADERDYAIAGAAARWAMQLYAWCAILAFFLLLAFQGTDPVWVAVAYTLSYSACALLLLYAITFRVFAQRKNNASKQWVAIIISGAILIGLAVALYGAIASKTLPSL